MELLIFTLSIFLSMAHSKSELKTGCFFKDHPSWLMDQDLQCVEVKVTSEMLQVSRPDHVRMLHLRRTDANLDKNLLKNLTGLNCLRMDECNISKFEPESSLLQKLYMNNTTLPNETSFDKCCENLESLFLWNSTGIDLERSVFAKLNRLEELVIHRIPSERLSRKIFAGLNSLKKLRIEYMNFETSDGDSFSELTHLEELRLYELDIHEIHPDIFKPLKSLTRLTVFGKQLKSLPLEMLSGLRELMEVGVPSKTFRWMNLTKMREMFPKLVWVWDTNKQIK